MTLMIALAAMMALGVGLTLWWSGSPYRTWSPGSLQTETPEVVPTLGGTARRYLRGVAVALVAGFWAGALVTGPAMRLIMRLLAATAGDAAQGAITEAEEVVGNIEFDGTFGLYIFGGLLPGLLSGFVYVLVRRWLPRGRWGGVTFGLLHLVVAATRVDPLRADNLDFGIVGPGWLSVLTFGVAAVVHGMAVAAFANRYSEVFPASGAAVSRAGRVRSVIPLVLPALLLIPAFFMLIPITIGLVFSLGLSRLPDAPGLARSPYVTRVGRVAGALLVAVSLPGTIRDLAAIVSQPQSTSMHSR